MDNQSSTTETIKKIQKLLVGINTPQDLIIGVWDTDRTFGPSLCRRDILPILLGLLEELQESSILKIEYVEPILKAGATGPSQYYWKPFTDAVKKIRLHDARLLTPKVVFALIEGMKNLNDLEINRIVNQVINPSKPTPAPTPRAAAGSSTTPPNFTVEVDALRLFDFFSQVLERDSRPLSTKPSTSKAFTLLREKNPRLAAQLGPQRFEVRETAIDEVLKEIFVLLDKKTALDEALVLKLLTLPKLDLLQFFLKITTLYSRLTKSNFYNLVVFIGEDTRKSYLEAILEELPISSYSLSAEVFSNLLENLEDKNGAEYFIHVMKVLKNLKENSLLSEIIISSLLKVSSTNNSFFAISALVDVGLLSKDNVEKVLLDTRVHDETDRTFSSMLRHIILYLLVDKTTFKEKASLLLAKLERENIPAVYSVVVFLKKYDFKIENEQLRMLCENKEISGYLNKLLIFLSDGLYWVIRDKLPSVAKTCTRIMDNLIYVKPLYRLLHLGLTYYYLGCLSSDVDEFIPTPLSYMDKIFANVQYCEKLEEAMTVLYSAEARREKQQTEYHINRVTFIRVRTLLKNPSSLIDIDEILQITVIILARNGSDLSEWFYDTLVTSSRLRQIIKKYQNDERLYLPDVMYKLCAAVSTSAATEEDVLKIMPRTPAPDAPSIPAANLQDVSTSSVVAPLWQGTPLSAPVAAPVAAPDSIKPGQALEEDDDVVVVNTSDAAGAPPVRKGWLW